MVELLDKVKSGVDVEHFQVQHEDTARLRTFLVSTRHVHGTTLVLLAFDDVTPPGA